MIRTATRIVLAFSAVTLLSCTTALTQSADEAPQPAGAEALLQRYIDAWNRHDQDAMRSMLSPEAVWKRQSHTIVGREEITSRVPYEAGIGWTVEITELTVVDDETADATQREHSELWKVLGLDPDIRARRYHFRDGLLVEIENLPDGARDRDRRARFREFSRWLERADPRLSSQLRNEVTSEEVGQRVLERARSWAEANPG